MCEHDCKCGNDCQCEGEERVYGMICTGQDFSQALYALRGGEAIQREGWNGKGLRVVMQVPDAHSKMSMPYFYIEYPKDHPVYPGDRCPWVPSVSDLLAKDWTWVVTQPS